MKNTILNLKAQLSAEYCYRTELHCHTFPVSGCSKVSPQQIAEIYAGKKYDALALTNHFLWREGKSADECIDFFMNGFYETTAAAEPIGVRVYLGAEIRFTENINDYLVYGIDAEALREIYELLPFGIENFAVKREQSRALRELLIVRAHPSRNEMTAVDAALTDGIEGFNMAPTINSRNGMTLRFIHDNNVNIITAGSDFHYPDCGYEGLAALRSSELPTDTYALADLLRSGDYLFELGEQSIVLP